MLSTPAHVRRAAILIGAIAAASASFASAPVRRAAAASVRARADSAEIAVRRIRAHYQTIQRELSTYDCRTLDLDGFSAEGGELRACYAPKGGELRKLTATVFGESGRGSDELIVWGGELEFVFVREERYTRPLSGEVQSVEEQRLYFERGRLVRWLGPGNVPRAVVGEDAEREAAEYVNEARKLAACAADRASNTCTADGR